LRTSVRLRGRRLGCQSVGGGVLAFTDFAGDPPQVVGEHAEGHRAGTVGETFGAADASTAVVLEDGDACLGAATAFLQRPKRLLAHALFERGGVARADEVVDAVGGQLLAHLLGVEPAVADHGPHRRVDVEGLLSLEAVAQLLGVCRWRVAVKLVVEDKAAREPAR